MATTSIRLPKELEAALNEVVRITKRTKSSIVKEALEEFILDTLDGYEAHKRRNEPTISHEELGRRLGF